MKGREGAKGGTEAEFAARLKAALSYKAVGVLEFARKAKSSRNALGRHLKGTVKVQPRIRRRYEQALGLPMLALDSGTPQEIVALLSRAPSRAPEPLPAPLPEQVGDLGRAFVFVRGQLEGYRVRDKPVPPGIVVSWLAELELAASAAAQSPGPGLPGSENVV